MLCEHTYVRSYFVFADVVFLVMARSYLSNA